MESNSSAGTTWHYFIQDLASFRLSIRSEAGLCPVATLSSNCRRSGYPSYKGTMRESIGYFGGLEIIISRKLSIPGLQKAPKFGTSRKHTNSTAARPARLRHISKQPTSKTSLDLALTCGRAMEEQGCSPHPEGTVRAGIVMHGWGG